MPKFVSLLIDRTKQRYLSFALWFATLVIILLAGVGLWGQLISMRMAVESQQMLEPQARVRQSITTTIGVMEQLLTAEPCSPAFQEKLRQIAFLPDGFNEFVFVDGGFVRCSVDADFPPYDLGKVDATDPSGTMIWYDRPLDFLGRAGLVGSFVVHNGFGIVVPPQPEPKLSTAWMRFELVNVGTSGSYWHRAGDEIFGALRSAGPWAAILPIHQGGYGAINCLPDGRTCIATTATLAAAIGANVPPLVLGLILSAILAVGISSQINALLRHFWSFEARFKRHFGPDSVLCTYQPILSLATGRISGCEVLVRWRDVDGAIVYPDQFLPVVERFALGRRLTEYVVAKAHAELSASVPPDQHLQVNINIFPRDLDALWLRDTLSAFEALSERFCAVVEIVETDLLQTEHAQREIEALRRFGIKTHLDDFGTGYSNIENLARLPIDGVKLDRSFAMSSEGSLMSRMLENALDMIHAAGHRITVEGVETNERLQMLRGTGRVDFIQGYLISRPVDIGRFVTLLAEHAQPTPMRPQLVA